MPKPVVDIETVGAHYSTVAIKETIYGLQYLSLQLP